MIAVVAAFASTPYAVDGLHDRSMFYVAPLWFVAFAGWLDSGMARPVAGIAVGAVGALLLVGQLPYHFVDDILWGDARLRAMAVRRARQSVRDAVLGSGGNARMGSGGDPRGGVRAACVALGARRARGRHARVHGLACVGARTGRRTIGRGAALVAAERKDWVDAAVPAEADVLLLRVTSACRDDVALSAQRVTEFFDDSLGPGAERGPPDRLAPPSTPAEFRDGVLVATETG